MEYQKRANYGLQKSNYVIIPMVAGLLAGLTIGLRNSRTDIHQNSLESRL